jgi:hypothetical protein
VNRAVLSRLKLTKEKFKEIKGKKVKGLLARQGEELKVQRGDLEYYPPLLGR